MVDYKITKCYMIKEVNNCMCHNFYYVYYGRIYNEDKTKYRKFKFVIWADIFDIMEFYEQDGVTRQEIKDYFKYGLDIDYMFTTIKHFNDVDGLKEFYKVCNEGKRRTF